MRKLFLTFSIILSIILIPTLVIATMDMSNTMWSLRGNVDESNIDNLKGIDIDRAWGSFSANLNLRWNHHSQGELAIQGYTNGEKFRFSLNWDDGGNYDIHFIDDNNERTIIDGHARVIFNRQVEYWVPIVVTFHKITGLVDIVGQDFEFDNIPVIDLTGNVQPPTPLPALFHDVALIDFLNSINKIRLEHTNGTDILGEESLQCNKQYRIGITVKNLGNFTENITYTGSIDSLLFEHLPTNNLAPGDSSLKTRIVNFTLPSGMHTITVEAHIPIDDVPVNNIAQREVNIVCD